MLGAAIAAVLAGLVAVVLAGPALAARKGDFKTPPPGTRVEVTADRLTYDSVRRVAVATGRVVITYGQYVLVARKVIYDRANDKLYAEGEVRLREPGGNVLEANVAQLQNRFRDGFARYLRLLLTNDATITAEYARRRDGYLTIYEKVAYTRCKNCTTITGAPLWEIRSGEVTHDEKAQRIYHRNATFWFYGVPVAYLPYLSHPDPTAKRASGFLIPEVSYSKELGFGLETPYFFALAPNYDLTVKPLMTSEQGPFVRAIWRHRLASGEYFIDAGGAWQWNKSKVARPGNKSLRGYIKTGGDFVINSRWRWGWDLTAPGDRTVMRRYKVDKRTDIDNVIHLTGIDRRNYFSVEGHHFLGMLTTDANSTFPIMAPAVRHEFTLDQPVLGGELGFDTSVYSLHRDRANTPFATVNHGTEQTRAIIKARWRRRIVAPAGIVATPFASVRGDVYATNNVPDPTVAGGFRNSETTARVIPSGGLDLRWPFVNVDGSGRHVITPVAQITASTNEHKTDRIGNEDAVTLNFDYTSLFLTDRFTGLDRVEGGTRVNVGLVYDWLMPGGGFLKIAGGQSYHIAGRNSFNVGSGLEGSVSDLVAGLSFRPYDNITLTYQARFDDHSLALNTQEASLQFEFQNISATATYVDLQAEPLYGRPTRQEQIWLSANVDLVGGWSLFGGTRYDIAADRQIRNLIGFGYDCDCFNFKAYYQEDFSRDGDVKKDRAVYVTVEFKTLGSTTVGSGL